MYARAEEKASHQFGAPHLMEGLSQLLGPKADPWRIPPTAIGTVATVPFASVGEKHLEMRLYPTIRQMGGRDPASAIILTPSPGAAWSADVKTSILSKGIKLLQQIHDVLPVTGWKAEKVK